MLKKITEYLEKNSAKIYLVSANIILVIFGIWFSNVGLLPFANLGDFAFFVVLAFLLGLYRPSWTFAFFIGTLALENINLAPQNVGFSLRPYQLFGFISIVSLAIHWSVKRMIFSLPKWKWFDALPIFFLIGGFMSSLAATNHGAAFKQAIVAVSFAALYYLSRAYVQTFADLKRIAPFFMSSGLIVAMYSIWQNVRFLSGKMSFEIMPGRPNATFTEPDWLGIYLVFLLSVMFAVIFYFSKRNQKSSVSCHQSSEANEKILITDDRLLMTKKNTLLILFYINLILIITSILLTVSRSAWLGAFLVTVGFLKIILTGGNWKISKWNWKDFAWHSLFTSTALAACLLITTGIPLTNFQIFGRAQSTGGLQKITISCNNETSLNSESVIGGIDELSNFGCKFINLEDIEKEKAQGSKVFEIRRPDPTVGIRAQIYQKSIEQIKNHSIFGIGWGSITNILGKDANGAGLNASNIFLETWLGSGIIGFLSLAILLLYILYKSAVQYLSEKVTDKTATTFVALGWFAIVVPNLFNSGIFLGFVWAYLAVAVGLISRKNEGR